MKKGRSKKIIQSLFLLFFFAVPFSLHAQNIILSEINFNPEGSDTGLEYVVIHNQDESAVDLTGWDLYPDGVGYYTFPTFVLGGGESVVLYLRATGTNSATTLYHSSASGNMGNTSGSVALFSSTDHSADSIIDFVQYGRGGETWESSADSAGIWAKGDFIDLAQFTEGSVLKKTNGEGSGVWMFGEVMAEANSEEESGSVGNSPTSESKKQYLEIEAYAGEDRQTVVGALVDFRGKGYGLKDELLEGDYVRFFWNFGDGESKEGKNVQHSYRYPGSYIVSLSVTSGIEHASDYVHIQVIDNPISISEFLPGVDGWVELYNNSQSLVNISGWAIKQNDYNFFMFPQESILSPRSYTIFSRDKTQLTIPFFQPKVELLYPNTVVAHAMSYLSTVVAGSSVTANGISQPTPGSENTTQNISVESTKSVVSKKVPETKKQEVYREAIIEQEESTTTPPHKIGPAVVNNTNIEELTPPKNRASLLSIFDYNKKTVLLLGSIFAGLILGFGLFFVKRFFQS